MTKTCFKLRHFNLPERFDGVLKQLANKEGEICPYGDSSSKLPYTGPFAALSDKDYLYIQSDFITKGLVGWLHSPDELRFAREGIAEYISDPQKRTDLINRVETTIVGKPKGDTGKVTVDTLKCSWEAAFKFPTWRSDDTLIAYAMNDDPYKRCWDNPEEIHRSIAHYFGLTEEQINKLSQYVRHDGRLWDGWVSAVSVLVRDGGRSVDNAMQLIIKTLDPSIFQVQMRCLPNVLALSKYGISDADLLTLYKHLYYSRPESFQSLDALFAELLKLGVSNPVGYIQRVDPETVDDALRRLLNVIDSMRDNGYSDDEMRWVVGQYPLINRSDWAVDLDKVFLRARKENVSFKEIRWILEDATGFEGRFGQHADAVYVYDIFKAYCHQAKRGHSVVYGLYQHLPATMAMSLEAADVVSFRERGPIAQNELLLSSFSKQFGMSEAAVAYLFASKSPVLWDFVFKHRAEAYIFDPQKMEDYKAIAKDLHNQGADPISFFPQVSFNNCALQSPPSSSLVEAARITHTLQSIDVEMAKEYVEKVVLPHWQKLAKSYSVWLNPKSQRIDVTRHNIKDVNALLALITIHNTVGGRFPMGFVLNKTDSEWGGVFADIVREAQWFVSHLDVEEFDVRGLSLEAISDYYELVKRLKDANANAASKYLAGNLLDLDARKIFAGMTTIADIEVVRKKSNQSYLNLGDKLVDNLGIAMLEKIDPTVANITDLQHIAIVWGLQDNHDVAPDNQGLYRQYANFANQMISDIVLSETDNWRDDDKKEVLKDALAKQNISLDALVADLEANGFPIRTESNWDKFKNRITTDPGYVFRRGFQKIVPTALQTTNLSGLSATVATDWTPRNGVTVQVISNAKGTEVARAIQCDRVVMGAEVLLSSHGLVDTDKRKQELGAAYVFSAPLNMTTPDMRTMTEIAYHNGEPMNWLMSARGKDGLLLVDKNHSPRILDKRAIPLSQLLEELDLNRADIKVAVDVWKRRRKFQSVAGQTVLDQVIQPFTRLADKLLFREVMRIKAYSLLNGMLFTAGSNGHRLEKESGAASRRLFTEFADGRFGVVDGTEYLTTEEAFEAAKAAGAVRSIYMDTGFWDQADYVDGNGKSHRLDPGQSNSSASTNRVIIRVK